jgi:hypothetical protein
MSEEEVAVAVAFGGADAPFRKYPLFRRLEPAGGYEHPSNT